jgi:hypothetical protein
MPRGAVCPRVRPRTLGCALAVGSVLAASAIAATIPTIRATLYPDAAAGTRLLRFGGEVPVARAGEEVTILGRECGAGPERVVGGTTTDSTGAWFEDGVWPLPNATYRARWSGRLSEAVRVKNLTLQFTVTKSRRVRRWTVAAHAVSGFDWTGRKVVLQRQTAGGGWVRLRDVRLRQTTPWVFAATLLIRPRALTVRVLFPARTVAPCFDAAATPSWRT